MSSNDNMEKIVMVKSMILKKNQERNIAVPKVIKSFNTVLHSQDKGSHTIRILHQNMNVKLALKNFQGKVY